MIKPLALVVFLENVGHLAGLKLPQWAMSTIDFVTEEYAKLLLHWHGAYRHYDRISVLEDQRATGAQLASALLQTSRTHTVDLLLLVHGHDGQLVGYLGRERVGAETFDALQAARRQDPASLDLRMVYGLNCYGLSLAPRWLALGAKVVNGSPGSTGSPNPASLSSCANGSAAAPTAKRSLLPTRRPHAGGASCSSPSPTKNIPGSAPAARL